MNWILRLWKREPPPPAPECGPIVDGSKYMRLADFVAKLDAEQDAEERQHPSTMWDWISPDRIRRPYERA